MTFNPLRWLWGVIPVAMLSWVTFQWESPGIEADLTRRAEDALEEAGQSWAEARFTGRDAELLGLATDQRDPRLASEALRSVWGVRRIKLRTDLGEAVSPYLWSASLEGNQVRLSGFVATDAMRAEVITRARSCFPVAAFDDGMTRARGAIRPELWLAGISFALRQLCHLKVGVVSLRDDAVSLSGQAADLLGHRTIESAIGQGLPRGLRFAKYEIALPVMSPFVWSAEAERRKILLQGFAPTQAKKDEVFEQARRWFPSAAIVDLTEAANGAPGRWLEAATASLNALSALREGKVTLRDHELELTGFAADALTAEAVRHALIERLPVEFTVTQSIEHEASLPFAEPAPPAAAADSAPVETSAAPAECRARLMDLLASVAIAFADSDAAIDAGSTPILDRIAEIAKSCPSAQLEVAGHSQQRAEAVADYLVRAGVDPSRIKAVARERAEESPTANGGIEFILLDN